MLTTLTIVRYPKWLGWAGLLSMAVFRIPLIMCDRLVFWKLLGCGKNGSFSRMPDTRQWGVLAVWNMEAEVWQQTSNNSSTFLFPGLLPRWWRFFRCNTYTFVLQPLEGHGTWDQQQCFGELPVKSAYDGRIAILTRATIRLKRLHQFWRNVEKVTARMHQAEGFLYSVGIGEMPWIRQATFSIWENKTYMKQFAYGSEEHRDVIHKTRANDWYSEEMFVRFRILAVDGENIVGLGKIQH